MTLNDKTFKLENVSYWLLAALAFLLPIFVLPFVVSPIASSKAVLLYAVVLAAAIFWLLAALRSGQIKIPKSSLLSVLAAMVLVWLFASFFSNNPAVSFFGKVYDIDTFSILGFVSLLMFLTSVLFQSEKRVFAFYFLLFISSFFLLLSQFLRAIFGADLTSVQIFQLIISNPMGSWNDFAIFFGFVGLTSLAFFELFKLEKWMKIILFTLLAFSMLAMVAVNFLVNWIIFGFFALVFFVFLLRRSFSSPDQKESKTYQKKFLVISLLIVIVSIFFIYDHIIAKKNNNNGIGGNINAVFNMTTLTVSPSWSATWSVAKQAIKSNPALGSGPNTFLYDWLKFKPSSINNTIFWNARFSSGIGHWPSALATTGLLGALALIGFFFSFLFYGAKIISGDQNNLSGGLMTISFLGAAYLWASAIFYTPGLTILALAFMMTGLMIAAMVRSGKIKVIELSFLNNAKIGFVSTLIIVLLLIGVLLSTYSYFQKFLALHYYGDALKIFNASGDLDGAEKKLTRAAKTDKQDEYFRTLSEINLIKMNKVISGAETLGEKATGLFSDSFKAAAGNAQEATKLNILDPFNWMQLGRIYESVVALQVNGAGDQAVYAYSQAANYAPSDPSPLLMSARVQAQSGKIKEARNYIKLSLVIKPDFAPALFLLSQIEAQEGNLKEAIRNAEQVAALSPNDIGAFFQLGLLYYQDNNLDFARLAFERTVALNANYANAKYFLGLIYDRQGKRSMAIEQFENILKNNHSNEEVMKILNNLRSGRNALAEISPPEKSPEKRKKPPISEGERTFEKRD